MTGTFGVSAKIASGRSTSPLRSPRASKNGTCNGFGSVASCAFLVRVSFDCVLVAAISRGPHPGPPRNRRFRGVGIIEDFLGCSYLPRVRLARGTLGLDLLGRLADQDQRAFCPRHTALEHQEVSLGVDPDHRIGARGGANVAHLAGHAHALEDAGGVGGADGAGLADVHRAVGLRAAAELVTLDETLETLAFAGRRHIDELTGGEDLGLELLSRLDTVVVADLDDVAVRVEVCLLELAEPRCVQPAFFHAPEGDAHGLVAVLLGGSQPEHPAGPGLENGDRGGRAVGVEQLGHAQLLGEQALHDLISMLTPAGRLRRMSASTTRGFGSRMSTIRLWVRISNCSRESLSMNGLRITVSFEISVGSGIGPAVRAFVRRAVSTILSAAWSSTRWSYALSRIRIFCATAACPTPYLCVIT